MSVSETVFPNESYYVVHGWMINELGLKGADLILYSIIYGFSQDGKSVFNGSLSYLAAATNTTTRNVLLCLKRLTESGLVEREEISIRGITLPTYKAVSPGVKKFHRGGEKISPNNIANNIDTLIPPIVPPSLATETEHDDDFDKFWSAYPLKKDKARARKAFRKVKVPLDTLLAALEAQKKLPDWTKENGRYIPHAATWLNGERWEDELEPTETHEPTPTLRRLT